MAVNTAAKIAGLVPRPSANNKSSNITANPKNTGTIRRVNSSTSENFRVEVSQAGIKVR